MFLIMTESVRRTVCQLWVFTQESPLRSSVNTVRLHRPGSAGSVSFRWIRWTPAVWPAAARASAVVSQILPP